MNFDFSEEQLLLRDQARKFLGERAAPARVRRVLESDAPYDEELWQGMVELAWPGTAIPEVYGGAGYGYLELCVLAEELGRSLAPTPFSSSVYLATEAILLAGTDDQKKRWLPKLAAGQAIGCLAVAEGPQALRPGSIATRAAGGQLTGVKIPVADGDVADLAVVLARTGDDTAALFLVDLHALGVSRTAVATIDPTRSHARIAFEGAAAERLGAPGEGWSLAERLLDRAAVLVAFEQVGGAQAALDMAREYALFFLDMKAPGIEVRRIKQISGASNFNEVYFTDVRVPDVQRLGAVGQGWGVAITTLMNERLAVGDVRGQGLRWTKFRTMTALSRGQTPGPEASIGKIVSAAKLQEVASFGLDLMDMGGAVMDPALAPTRAAFQEALLYAPGARIAGGTDEILKNILAERVLGLPADVRVDKDPPFEDLPTGRR